MATGADSWLGSVGPYLSLTTQVIGVLTGTLSLVKLVAGWMAPRRPTSLPAEAAGLAAVPAPSLARLTVTAARALLACFYGPPLALFRFFKYWIFFGCLFVGIPFAFLGLLAGYDQTSAYLFGVGLASFAWLCAGSAYEAVKAAENLEAPDAFRNILVGAVSGAAAGAGIALLASVRLTTHHGAAFSLGFVVGFVSGVGVGVAYEGIDNAKPLRERDRILNETEEAKAVADLRDLNRTRVVSGSVVALGVVLSPIEAWGLGGLGHVAASIAALIFGYSVTWAPLAIADVARSHRLSEGFQNLVVYRSAEVWRGDEAQIVDARRFGRLRMTAFDDLAISGGADAASATARACQRVWRAARWGDMLYLCETRDGRWFIIPANDVASDAGDGLTPVSRDTAQRWLEPNRGLYEQYFVSQATG